MRYQKNSANDLLVELWKLKIDEVLHLLVAEARRLDQRATCFAQPASNITIRLPVHVPTPSTDMTTNYSMEQDTGGPSWPIIIIDDDTTTHQPPQHRRQDHHSRNGRDQQLLDERVATFDASDKTLQIWDLRFRKGVMLWFHYLILSHLITQTTFSFQRSLPGNMLPPSLLFVIVHCTIHVFQILWLIVYATHSFYLGSCTYISRDPSSSIDSS